MDRDLSQQLRDREFEIQVLHEIGMATVSGLRLPALLQMVADKVRVLISAETLLIPMLDDEHANYIYAAASGKDAEDIAGETFSTSIGMCGWVLQNQRPLLYGESDRWTFDDKTPWEEGQVSAILVPLFVGHKIIGGIAGTGKEGATSFSVRDMELLQLISSQVSIAIDNSHMFDELRNLVDTLESKVEERTLELQIANTELESFSYSVSHDLRAPLRSIDGFSTALLEDYADKLDGEAKGYLERLKANAVQMGKLIDAMLGLSRVSRSALKKSNINLSELASKISLRLQEQDSHRQVEIEISPNLVVEGDPVLAEALLTNLFSNAWKYTAKVELAHIKFGHATLDNRACLCVSDNGAGFDVTRKNKLFKPFQRLHSAKEFEGTGIGLATVQRIINRHGGWIEADAALGQGASFYFSLGQRDDKGRTA